MKLFWKEILVCLIMGLVVPGALMEVSGSILQKNGKLPPEPEPTLPVVAQTTRETLPEGPEISVRFGENEIRKADLEEYLVGVVLAEMPASFETEALKAQAVAARTYAGKAHRTGGKHGDGSVCTQDRCCQAWMDPEEYLKQGGMPQAVEKVRYAVAATAGEVLIYRGELIEATYFSCSGGSTEDAKAVWGSDFPYLRAVESPGEEQAQPYEETRSFSREKLEMLLDVVLPDDPGSWLGEITRTPGQGVDQIVIGGKTFTGTQLRGLLGLRSTFFTASSGERGLVITTRGYGHRVGLSQYGADAMAAAGKSYVEILGHYYQGTVLCQLSDLETLNQGTPEK